MNWIQSPIKVVFSNGASIKMNSNVSRRLQIVSQDIYTQRLWNKKLPVQYLNEKITSNIDRYNWAPVKKNLKKG
jgi:hypothetical protein